MPTIADMIDRPESYPIWAKGRWSRKARVADAIDMMSKQKEFDEASADKEAQRRKALVEAEYGFRGGNEAAADARTAERMVAEDERRGLTAEGDMRKTKSKEFIAGSPSRMRVQDAMGAAAEDEALATKIKAGQRLARTPSLGAAGLNAELAEITAKSEEANWRSRNPAIAYQLEAMKTLGNQHTAEKSAQVEADSRLKAARLQANRNEDGSLASTVQGTKPGRINLKELAAKVTQAQPGQTAEDGDANAEAAGKLIKLIMQQLGLGGSAEATPQ